MRLEVAREMALDGKPALAAASARLAPADGRRCARAHAGAGLVLPEEVLQLGDAQTFKTMGASTPLLQT